jgi:hypothetical protein
MAGGEHLASLSAEMRLALAEMEQAADELRSQSASLLAEVEVERQQLREARERATQEYAEQARDGEAGAAREELQDRIDQGETTWREVLSGEDQHWSAVEVRDEIVGDARAEVDRVEREDPEMSERYRRHATLRRGDRIGEWTHE